MKAGRLRSLCEFQRPVQEINEIGEVFNGWELVTKAWGDLVPESGREQVKAGRLESDVPGTLEVRYSSDVAGITAENRVIIAGVAYQIRTVMDPDMRRRRISMLVESGVAV